MSEQDGLVFACLLDGEGGARDIKWADIARWSPSQGMLWMHLEKSGEKASEWLSQRSGINPVVVRTLIADDSRPRVTRFENSLLVNLRGINYNPGAEPEDMVAVPMFVEENRIVSVHSKLLRAVTFLRRDLAQRDGPKGAADFILHMASHLVSGTEPVVGELVDLVDDLEEALIADPKAEVRATLATLRHDAIIMRRHMAPQSEVMAAFQTEHVSWADSNFRAAIHESEMNTTRFVDDLTAVRERAVVIQEEYNSHIADRTNKAMYLLTLVATLMMPLNLLTSLLGANVGGIPGSTHPLGFTIVVGALLVILPLEIYFLKRLKWI